MSNNKQNNNQKDILYLGSKSSSRRKLIELADIKYVLLEHESDECGIDLEKSFSAYVLSIARHKMEKLILPDIKDFKNQDHIFVLTADTLVRTINSKHILTKPGNVADAKRMLTLLRQEPAEIITACCLEKKILQNDTWVTDKQDCFSNLSIVDFCVPENYVDLYFQKEPHALKAAGSAAVENYGLNFFKNIKGSFTGVLGLPLFELREALQKIGFNF
ncbi:Maf family protein [Candidatus Babeliales bacterium]|nr:Maf family protein [Candidatus Babeliales bacterium]